MGSTSWNCGIVGDSTFLLNVPHLLKDRRDTFGEGEDGK